jgi:hypothetical protein
MNDLIRVENPADPNRCQATDIRGQCPYKAVEGGTVCMKHGGNKQIAAQERQSLNNYRLTKFKYMEQLNQHANSDGLKSLRDEIAILRVLMQERLERCTDSTELMMHSGPISDLVMKIDKIVTSCHKIERSMGALLDKKKLIQFSGEVVQIISEELADVENSEMIMEQIADRIIQAMGDDEDV